MRTSPAPTMVTPTALWTVAVACVLVLAGCQRESVGGRLAARETLNQVEADRPVLTRIHGNPFDMDASRQNALVTTAFADGVRGRSVRFTTDPAVAGRLEPRLVVLLNPAGEPTGVVACDSPELVTTEPARGSVRVVAVFCQAGRALGVARAEDVVNSPTDQRYQRLMWRASGELFPDDYWENYGFGFLPRWIDFGIGGGTP